jgi:hypothetical protein
VKSWADLVDEVETCPGQCAYELPPTFVSPAGGFHSIEVLASKHVTIYGRGVAVIDAHKGDQMFYVRAGGSLTMNGVIMGNGGTASNGGAIYCITGHLGCAFTNCTFRNNVAAATSSPVGNLAGAVNGGSAFTN